jgi:ABC-type glucose/galactose transport system permease subunit
MAVFPVVLPVAFGLVVSAGLDGCGAVVFGLAAVVAGLLSLFDVSAFFTPPWLEQAPLPVAVEVVPSLHVTVAGLA